MPKKWKSSAIYIIINYYLNTNAQEVAIIGFICIIINYSLNTNLFTAIEIVPDVLPDLVEVGAVVLVGLDQAAQVSQQAHAAAQENIGLVLAGVYQGPQHHDILLLDRLNLRRKVNLYVHKCLLFQSTFALSLMFHLSPKQEITVSSTASGSLSPSL